MLKKYEVVMIGWENQNEVTPLVLLSKSERNKLGVNLGDPVRVYIKQSEIEVGVISSVGRQFLKFVDDDNVCSVNGQLAEKLKLNLNSKVYISRDVTESEYNQFMKDTRQIVFLGIELGER